MMGRFPHEPRLHSSSSKYLKVSLLQVNWCVRALTGNQLLCSKNIKSWKKKCKKRITTKNNLVQLGENMWKVTITHDCSWFLPLSRYCKLPQMIPHRKWSPEWTASDPHCRPQMIPRGKSKWPGLKLLDHRVKFVIATKSIRGTRSWLSACSFIKMLFLCVTCCIVYASNMIMS